MIHESMIYQVKYMYVFVYKNCSLTISLKCQYDADNFVQIVESYLDDKSNAYSTKKPYNHQQPNKKLFYIVCRASFLFHNSVGYIHTYEHVPLNKTNFVTVYQRLSKKDVPLIIVKKKIIFNNTRDKEKNNENLCMHAAVIDLTLSDCRISLFCRIFFFIIYISIK